MSAAFLMAERMAANAQSNRKTKDSF